MLMAFFHLSLKEISEKSLSLVSVSTVGETKKNSTLYYYYINNFARKVRTATKMFLFFLFVYLVSVNKQVM